MPMLWIQSRVNYTLNLPHILSKRQLSNSKHSQPFIILQSIWILQSLNPLGSTTSPLQEREIQREGQRGRIPPQVPHIVQGTDRHISEGRKVEISPKG